MRSSRQVARTIRTRSTTSCAFPFIFRGALDVGATTITEEMKLAAVLAIAELAQVEQSEIVRAAYGEQPISFGPEYLIPKPFDPRLIVKIAPAVAQAAMDSGVATRPIEDFEAYRQQLNNLVWISGLVMKPVFAEAKRNPKRIIYAEGEDERVLSAVRNVVDEGLARPILIGRRDVVLSRIQKLGLRLRPEVDFELVTPDNDPRYKELWSLYYSLTQRKGISVDYAKLEARRRTTLIGALLTRLGYADGLICGTFGHFGRHLGFVRNVLGLKEGLSNFYAMNLLNLPGRTVMLVRYVRQLRSDRRTGGRNDGAGRRGSASFRHRTQDRAAVALEFRIGQHADRRKDAPCPADAARRLPASRSRG
jgi:malate dehydrogenase (oxaloacetate-decarboxylating)(NADP+)